MINHYGGIFKINRLEQSVVQEYIVNKVDQNILKIKNTGALSNIERCKDTLKEDKVAYLFSLLDLEFDLSKQDEINEMVEKYFNIIIDKKIGNIDYQEDYDYILSREKEIKTSLSYPKYLLLKLDISLHKELNDIDYEFIFDILMEHKEYLEKYQISNLYYNKGLYYLDKFDYQEALYWFEQAENYNMPTNYKGMLYFHKSTLYGIIGEYFLAIETANKAKNYFDQILCYKKSIACYFKSGIYFSKNGDFDKARSIYNYSIIKSKEFGREDLLPLIRNNMCWIDIRCKDYQSLVDNANELLKYNSGNPESYFYLAWGYEHLNQKSKANENIKLAMKYNNHCDIYMAKMITIYSHKFSLKSKVENIKRDLYQLYRSMRKNNFDCSATLFVIEMLIEVCHENHDYKQENDYLKEYMEFSLKKK